MKLSERGANPRQVPPSTLFYISTKGRCIVQIESINNRIFTGRITASPSSRRQTQAFDAIYPELEKYTKPIKNLHLHISGGPYDVLMWSSPEESAIPRMFFTKVESLEPKVILESAQEVINKHINSKFYKETVESGYKQSPKTRCLNKIKSLIGGNKNCDDKSIYKSYKRSYNKYVYGKGVSGFFRWLFDIPWWVK